MAWTTPTKIVKVRKDRTCEWCGQIIPAKTEASTWGWADGGTMQRGYMHPECKDACERDYRKHGNEEWAYYGEPRGMTQEEADA